jgi:tetratricopeptide (TPR) repeat protein
MYEEVLRLNQDQPEVKNNLAWLLVNSPSASEADLDRALELAQSAKESLPNNPSVADTLGWVMLKKKVCSAATSLFHEAIAAYPEAHPLRGTVRFHLAHSYECDGEVDRAISELTRALEEVPSFAERRDAEAMLARLRSRS